MVPGLGHLAPAALPHRPDVAFERIEVSQRWRLQDRRPEPKPGRVEDRVVVAVRIGPVRAVGPRNEGPHQLRERLDPHARGKVRVECRDRRAVEDGVMGEPLVGGHPPPSGDLEIEPARGLFAWIERRSQPPRRTRRPVQLSV